MMEKNYWREQYGFKSPEFIDGMIAGVTEYAVWKDGTLIVGIREKLLNDVIKEIREGLQ